MRAPQTRGEVETDALLRGMRQTVEAHRIAVKALESIAEEETLAGCLAKTTLEQITAVMAPPYMPLRDEMERALGDSRR